MAKRDYTNWNRNDLINEIESLRKRKKYGLIWEDKPENVVEQCKKELPVLEEVKDKEIFTDPDKPVNLLIEGDNYHALSVLNYTHRGRIDVIYIDPPYNTGAKDWRYNNDYVDSNDRWRHSKWISFMKNRLQICKGLLSKNGVIIIAIDDNEVASLSLLLDEVFPHKVRNTVVIVSNPHGVSRSGFSRTHEYAIFLLNQGQTVNKKSVPEDSREINLRRSGNNSLRADSPTMFYPIFVDKKTLKIIGAGEVPNNEFHPKRQTIEKEEHFEIWPIDSKNVEKNWYYSKKRVLERGSYELFIKVVKNQVNVYFKHSNESQQTYKSVWFGSEYDAGAYGSTLVKTMIGANFPFPKSLNTVIDCLRAVLKNNNSTVLDFFAGSGTTGHAVLELNKEDNGNRKFILCTNNELNGLEEELRENGLDKQEIQEYGICRAITYPRIKRVVEGYGDTRGMKTNLKYFKTSFVPADPTDKNKTELTLKATEMLCIKEDTFEKVESKDKFMIFKNRERYTGIIFDHQAIDDFKKAIKSIDSKFSVYVFSLGDDTFDEEFADIKSKVKLSPVPEAILRVYRRIFK